MINSCCETENEHQGEKLIDIGYFFKKINYHFGVVFKQFTKLDLSRRKLVASVNLAPLDGVTLKSVTSSSV